MTQQTLSQAMAKTDPNKAASTGKELDDFLNRHKGQFALALPKHMNPDRMVRLALTAFNSPTAAALRKCSMSSIAASIVTASQMGLEPGVQGQGFLIPYGTTCQFVPGWQGIVDLVNRSGNGTVYTGVIFKDQKYTYRDGSKRELEIHNETELVDPEDITHAYAIGWVRDSVMPIIELWTVGKIRKHRDRYNKVGNRHYSFQNWEMYARKIPLLQVCKYMPKSIELATALSISDASDTGKAFTMDGEFAVLNDTDEQAKQGEGQEHNKGGEPQTTFEDIKGMLEKSTTSDALDDAWSQKDLVQGLTKKQDAELAAIYSRRDQELRQ